MPKDRLATLLERLRQTDESKPLGHLLDACLDTGDNLAEMPDAVLEDRIGRFLQFTEGPFAF